MSWLVYLGAGVALAGVGLLGLVIRRALRLRDAPGADPEETARRLRALMPLNLAALALGGLGLALMVLGGVL
jgi:hypothetical protein